MKTVKIKQRPIPISDALILPTYEGIKTQARRCNKLDEVNLYPGDWFLKRVSVDGIALFQNSIEGYRKAVIACPYGKIGDRLWVRETHFVYGQWVQNGLTKTGRQKWKFKRIALHRPVFYVDTLLDSISIKPNSHRKRGWYKRLGRFMFRKDSRINLEITDIRVERIQGISDVDILAEGVGHPIGTELLYGTVTQTWNRDREFIPLWKKINGPDSWDANPWVWAISFKAV